MAARSDTAMPLGRSERVSVFAHDRSSGAFPARLSWSQAEGNTPTATTVEMMATTALPARRGRLTALHGRRFIALHPDISVEKRAAGGNVPFADRPLQKGLGGKRQIVGNDTGPVDIDFYVLALPPILKALDEETSVAPAHALAE